MLDFDAPTFAIAGLLAALGPLLVHLLNRRRYRVVAWAAMDFLREALERRRRMFQIRDVVLLILRMGAVVLLGLALARPFLRGTSFSGIGGFSIFLLAGGAIVSGALAATLQSSARRGVFAAAGIACLIGTLGVWSWSQSRSDTQNSHVTGRTPVHAVIVLDNSRSMGVHGGTGTLLDTAKQLAMEWIDSLPSDSRISVIPLAGSESPLPLDAHASPDDARTAIERITLVDSAESVSAGLELAEEACRQLTDPEIKRVAVISDLQEQGWSHVDWETWANRLPGLQIAPVDPGEVSNLWIDAVSLEDRFAGVEAPARILARVRYAGESELAVAEATLLVDGIPIGSQVVELSPGQTRELEFSHQFESAGEPGRPRWSVFELRVRPEAAGHDRLSADNQRTLISPVVDAIPVIFVDQEGDREDVKRNRIGETYALRHLLAPKISREETPRRIIHVEHVRPDGLTPELLEAARLVVIAGVESPGDFVDSLRQYLVQGGPVLIVAGGDFDPEQWQNEAWREGRGILPAPLRPELVGALPESLSPGRELQPFFADFESMTTEDFRIEGEEPETLSNLFQATPFFRAAQVDADREVLTQFRAAYAQLWQSDLAFLQSRDPARLGGRAESSETAEQRAADARYDQLEPRSWLWRSPLPIYGRQLTAEQLAAREQPRVLARFATAPGLTEALPWVVERQIGAGRSVFFSSGVTSNWNLLRSSSAIYVLHRLMYRLMSSTLPVRNFTAGEVAMFPLSAGVADRFVLNRPTTVDEPLSLEALGADVTGLVVRRPLIAGIYRIRPDDPSAVLPLEIPGTAASSGTASLAPSLIDFAVDAPASESELQYLTPRALQERAASFDVRILEFGESLQLEGGPRRGRSLWKWLTGAMLAALLLEMTVLAASARPTGGAA